jgi:hypothetical protein
MHGKYDVTGAGYLLDNEQCCYSRVYVRVKVSSRLTTHRNLTCCDMGATGRMGSYLRRQNPERFYICVRLSQLIVAALLLLKIMR